MLLNDDLCLKETHHSSHTHITHWKTVYYSVTSLFVNSSHRQLYIPAGTSRNNKSSHNNQLTHSTLYKNVTSDELFMTTFFRVRHIYILPLYPKSVIRIWSGLLLYIEAKQTTATCFTYPWLCKSYPFTLQYATFQAAKGMLLRRIPA